jgi:hypothetical protein
MTKTLRDTFHEQADAREFAVPDFDAIVRQGDRRVRRRRTAGIAAVAAGVLVVACASLLLPHGGTPGRPVPPLATGSTQPLVWSAGTSLHQDDRTFDLGRKPHLMAQTANGVVYATGDLQVFAFDGTRSRQVGTVAKLYDAHPRLVADEQGTSVAWLERAGTDVTLAVLDVATGDVDRSALPTYGKRSAEVRAVDDGTVYLFDGRDMVSRDVATGKSVVLRAGADSAETLQDVAGGQFLHPGSDDRGMAIGNSLAPRKSSVPNVYGGDLSPDAQHWFTQDSDAFSVFDSATGERTDPPHPGYEFVAPYQWLDDDTIAALALKGQSTAHIALLTCTVSTDTCEVSNPDIGGYREVMLPFGEPFDG